MFSTYNGGAGRAESIRYGEQLRREAAEAAARSLVRTPEQVRAEEEFRARVAAAQERRATMPRLVGWTCDPLTEAEKAQARRARGRMLRNGHKPAGYFRHVQGERNRLAVDCAHCGRWIAVDAGTGEFSGTAAVERCS